jgi:hypothetical protein
MKTLEVDERKYLQHGAAHETMNGMNSQKLHYALQHASCGRAFARMFPNGEILATLMHHGHAVWVTVSCLPFYMMH